MLTIVDPATVIAWHRTGFRLFWRWKSRSKGGRPRVDPDVRAPIKTIWRDNPTWGSPRIRDELAKLDIHVSDSTIRLYRPHPGKPSSQTWKTFLKNHAGEIAAIDFFIVPTLTFRLLYVFIVMRHERREIAHVNVTRVPSAAWTAQQMVEAFLFDTPPRYVIRDRDSIYGSEFRRRVQSLGIEQVITAYRSPWQNPYVERIIGSIRRACVDHILVVNEQHLSKMLRSYLAYYHDSRTHLGLAGIARSPAKSNRKSVDVSLRCRCLAVCIIATHAALLKAAPKISRSRQVPVSKDRPVPWGPRFSCGPLVAHENERLKARSRAER